MSFAKVHKLGFIHINLPSNWQCNQEEQDWVCHPQDGSSRSEAILIAVNKNKDEVDDHLPKYRAHLKIPRDMVDLAGVSSKSKVRYVKDTKIQGHPWIDALHLGSEIPGFFTRYLATSKEKIATLVTYSISESAFAKHSKTLDTAIKTLSIRFDQKTYEKALELGPQSLLGQRNNSKTSKYKDPEEERGDLEKEIAARKKKKEAGDGISLKEIIGLLVIAGVIGYIIMKRRKA